MQTTNVVTAFIMNGEKFLILKRSDRVRTMRGLWSAVSGTIEADEEPLERAKIEIVEETGIKTCMVKLVRAAPHMKITSPQHNGVQWTVFPFLFEVQDVWIRLNWENSEYRWIKRDELHAYRTVPSLEEVLLCLL